jgi:predicted permease
MNIEMHAALAGWRGLWLHTICDVITSAPGQVLGELGLDLKHGIRVYRRRSLSMSVALIALGLTFGVSTGVFSVLNALLLRSLPFSNPAQLAELSLSPVDAMSGRAAFQEWYRNSPYLQDAAAFSSSDMNLTGSHDAFRVKAAETTANFFSLLGINPVIGRTFTTDEDILGHNAVAVIGHALWQQLFGGDPGVVGKSLDLNGARVTIIGVAPASFDYPGKTTIWIPTVFDFEKIPKRGAFLFQTIGRLKPDITPESAREMFRAEIVHTNPKIFTSASEENRPHLVSLQNQLAGPVRQASWALAGMTLMVLLTACANVAHLLLSRAAERRQELRIRAALGASRARLLQQLITEAMFVTMIGAAIGLVVGRWTVAMASSVVPAQLATQQYTILDWRVLGFAIVLALVMGIIFGASPAWLLGRFQPSESVQRNQPAASNFGTKRARRWLVVLQAALTLCLLTSSLALRQAFLQMLDANLGFHPTSVVTLNVSLQGTRHSAGRGEWQYYSEALERLRALPGVQAAGAVSYLPLADNIYMANSFKLDSGQTVQRIVMNAVTPGFFRAMGTSFQAGRDFTESGRQHAEHPVIVNEAFAQSTGLEKGIIGHRLTAPWTSTPYLIVGVVNTMRFSSPATPGGPQIYWPVEEEPPPTLTFVAKVRGWPESYLAQCRDAVRMIDPEVPVYDVKTLDQGLADVLLRPRFYTQATGFLAILAALLAAVSIYGTAANSIAQRRHELGVRMAVGASYQRVRAMMLRESMTPAIAGMAVGILLSVASGRYLEHLVANTTRPAFWTYVAAAGLLLLTGLTAAWSATRRVLAIDPVDALRAE